MASVRGILNIQSFNEKRCFVRRPPRSHAIHVCHPLILSTAARLNFPFETDSPFLFAVYHLDRYPTGNDKLGPAVSPSGHRI